MPLQSCSVQLRSSATPYVFLRTSPRRPPGHANPRSNRHHPSSDRCPTTLNFRRHPARGRDENTSVCDSAVGLVRIDRRATRRLRGNLRSFSALARRGRWRRSGALLSSPRLRLRLRRGRWVRCLVWRRARTAWGLMGCRHFNLHEAPTVPRAWPGKAIPPLWLFDCGRWHGCCVVACHD